MWVPALPRKNDLINILCGNLLPDEEFEGLFRHFVMVFDPDRAFLSPDKNSTYSQGYTPIRSV